MDLVLYHAGCFDGFCAAWICHKHFPNAEYAPVQYGQQPPDVSGKDVMIVDFSFKRAVLLAMKAKAKSLLVLDHHKTAQEDLDGLDFCTFDMSKSGARIAWEYFQSEGRPIPPKNSEHYAVCYKAPWLVDYTEDRDLWLHKLPCTKEINASLRTMPMDFTAWDLLYANPDATKIMATEGAAIIRYQKRLIESHVIHAEDIDFMGHKVPCVNCTCADLTSEIAGALAIGKPFGVCWFETGKKERIYSLRSRDDGLDVSEIAKANGGGGHRNAAGFSVKL